MAARFQIASVGEYCDDKEDFESYTERLSAWLVVNSVTDDQKSSVFLAVIGASTYKLLKSLLEKSRDTEKVVGRSKLNVGQGSTTSYGYVNGYRKYC